MQTINVQQGQTLLDIAMQGNGDASKAFEIAVLNGLSLTDDVNIGDALTLNDANPMKSTIVNNFLVSGNPASADLLQSTDTGPQGINYWAIEKDFKVS